MLDTNNREIRTGDFVKISGAYFNSANGVYLVERASGQPNYGYNDVWLHKVKKSGELCKNRAGSTLSLPMAYYCSDRNKNIAAKKHDAENLRYEVTDGIPTYYAAEHFKKSAADYAERAKRQSFSSLEWEQEEAKKNQDMADFMYIVADRLSETAVHPKPKETEHGIKFYWNGIKVDGGELIRCWYSLGDNEVFISAKDYDGDLPKQYFDVRNDTDLYTDYFCKDSTTLTPEHPLYKYARYVALKNVVNGKDYRNPTDAQKGEFQRMSNPGQPTDADLAAIDELRTARENAIRAAEHAAECAEREKMLIAKNEGKRYIESVMEQHPVKDGEPVVTICWSEHPAFYAWEDDALKMSVAAAEIILSHFDEQRHAENEASGNGGYYKTKFLIEFTQDGGEPNNYEGRYDLGDNDGGLIAHIREFGYWHRTHDAFGHEIENPPQELSENEVFADWLEQFTDGGRIVNVTVDENLIDLCLYRKQKEKESLLQARLEMQGLFDKVAMLTDEQIEAAVMCIDPHDKDKIDVARFFLQELARRDEDKALDVFRRWQTGA